MEPGTQWVSSEEARVWRHAFISALGTQDVWRTEIKIAMGGEGVGFVIYHLC